MATVTLLFTDLVGSTELLTRLGDDANERVRRIHFRMLREASQAHRGEEVKNLGDGLMVVFPSALDAVDCAVAMQRAVARHAGRGDTPMAIRVGMHVGEPILDEGDYFGSAVVTAKRLCDAAGAGQILVSELVRGVVGSRGAHRFRPVGALELKGLGEPVAACEVEWRSSGGAVALPPSLTKDAAPLVARADELRRLEALVGEAAAGPGRFALLAGEPGIGKTRLATELARVVHARGATVLYGRCDEDSPTPYQPFVEIVRHFAASVAPEVVSRFTSAPQLARVVPELATDASPPSPAEADVERARLLEAVAGFLAEVAAGGSLLVILDDLHWADQPTLAALRHLVRSGLPAGVTVVGTYRDIEVDRRHPFSAFLADVRSQGLVERILLRGLDEDGVHAFLEARAGTPLDESGRALARALHVETEGNPFFVREIVRHLVESGAVHQVDGRWTSALPIDRVGLPESVRDVIGRRLSQVGDTCNDVLRVASVLGREFPLAVVAQVLDLADDVVADVVDEAVRLRVVLEHPTELDRYAFSHMLVREALYAELSTSRRVRLHQRIARALEASPGADVGELARHYREAALLGDVTKAVEYGLLAGDRAMAMLAYEEAVDIYEQTVHVVRHADPPPADAEAELLLRLGEARLATGDSPAARADFVAAAEVARRTGDAERVARAALGAGGLWPEIGAVDAELRSMLEGALAMLGRGDSPSRCRLLSRLAMELAFSPEVAHARELSDESLAMARRLGTPLTLAYAEVARRHAITGPRSLDERLAIIREAAAIAEREGDVVMAHRAHAFLQADAVEAGDFASAMAAVDAIVEVGDRLHQPRYEYLTTLTRAVSAHREGRFDDARELAATAKQLAIRIGRMTGLIATTNLQVAIDYDVRGGGFDVSALSLAVQVLDPAGAATQATQAVFALGEGDHAGARAALQEAARRLAADAPDDWTFYFTIGFAVRVCSDVNDRESAAVLLEQLLPYDGRHLHASGTALTVYIGPVSWALGTCARIVGRVDDAVRWLEQAIAEAAAFEAPPARARAELELARVLVQRDADGDLHRARDLAAAARDTGRALGMLEHTAHADALLADLAARR